MLEFIIFTKVSKMAESANLFTYFVLPAMSVLSIVSGNHGTIWYSHRYSDDSVGEPQCNSIEKFHGLECAPFCRRPLPVCILHCLCEDGKVLCDIHSGSCSCRNPGWKWPTCTEPCDEGNYGLQCGNKCRCENNATCDRFNGQCTCAAGYQGSLCKEKCPKGTHGEECSNECKCQNDAICHHVDGSCDCTAGWMGSICTEPCLEGTYGVNCSETCDCFRNAPCNVTTGDCIYTDDVCDCRCDADPPSETKELNVDQERTSANKNNSCFPGFSGKNCENRVCSANKWGQNCSNECKCRNGSYCHPLTGGCWCELGWAGEDCSVSLNEARFQQQVMEEGYTTSHSSLIVAAVCIPLVAILLSIIASVIFYRKRSSRNDDNLALPPYSQLDDKDM